jgi:uncharacterized membrane protein YozB (DUF420 family)
MRRSAGLIRVTVAALVVIGVASSVGRSRYPDSLVSRIEPVRASLLDATGTADPMAAERTRIVARVDARFGDHIIVTYIHVVLGSVFLLLAPLQFSERLRDRHRQVHRWTGRVLVSVGIVAAMAGMFFGVIVPFAGNAERIVVGIFGASVIGALATAFILIRLGKVAAHRAWMIRAFALMLGISTVRIVALVLDLALTPLAYSAEAIFVASLWIGWVGTLAVAELWLRQTAQQTSQIILSRSAV